ncbi:MAG TPA: hypothetical protein DCM73_14770 [Clostridiales bacterium]|nr:hypothetical protein [Clostridiales bacterium]
MNASEQIAQFEKNNPMKYLDYQVTSWGRMFSDKNNKESFKSNYAVINKDENIDAAIKEIEEYPRFLKIRCSEAVPSGI